MATVVVPEVASKLKLEVEAVNVPVFTKGMPLAVKDHVLGPAIKTADDETVSVPAMVLVAVLLEVVVAAALPLPTVKLLKVNVPELARVAAVPEAVMVPAVGAKVLPELTVKSP